MAIAERLESVDLVECHQAWDAHELDECARRCFWTGSQLRGEPCRKRRPVVCGEQGVGVVARIIRTVGHSRDGTSVLKSAAICIGDPYADSDILAVQ